jgi:hypothetical protein
MSRSPLDSALPPAGRSAAALALVLWTGAMSAQAPPARPTKATVDVLVSEAARTDERLLAYLARFKAALSEREGDDPQVLMLKASEVEGEALVVRPGGPAELLIWQDGQWISSQNRQLRPWATQDVAAANAFRASQVREAAIRDAIRAYRRQPGKATDYVGDLEVGYEPVAGALVAKLMTASLSSAGTGSMAFDPMTGKSVTIARAVAPVTPRAPARQTDDMRHEIPRALAAVRDAAPDTRLGAVRITRQRIDVTLADRSTYTFDPTFVLTPGTRYDGTWLCEQGFGANEVNWLTLQDLAHIALINGRLDEEDEVHARYTVDRSRDCGPIEIEVVFDNYEIPQPWVKFDASGHYKGKWR